MSQGIDRLYPYIKVDSVAKNSTDFKVIYTARFEFDHPFLVYIFDPQTKTILSMDRLLNPAQ